MITHRAAAVWRTLLAAAASLTVHAGSMAATEVVPTHEGHVLETLAAPTVRRQAAAATGSMPAQLPALLQQVRSEVVLARETGDPRHWGRAQALLAPWWNQAGAPVDVAVLQATVLQGRHAFDAAQVLLRDVVAREPAHAQAWLNLAALERLRGQYPASLRACDALARAGAALYAAACGLETRSLLGEHDAAVAGLQRLTGDVRLPDQRGWLLSLLGEALERSGDDTQAFQAYRASLRAAPDLYTAIALSDLLLRSGQVEMALVLLESLAPTDAVLLRRASALRRLGDERWRGVRSVLQSRAGELLRRGDDPDLHGREAALVALWLDDDPRRALQLAQRNLLLQREPVDWWVALQSAAKADDPAAWTQLQQQRQATGLHDLRLEVPAPRPMDSGRRP